VLALAAHATCFGPDTRKEAVRVATDSGIAVDVFVTACAAVALIDGSRGLPGQPVGFLRLPTGVSSKSDAASGTLDSASSIPPLADLLFFLFPPRVNSAPSPVPGSLLEAAVAALAWMQAGIVHTSHAPQLASLAAGLLCLLCAALTRATGPIPAAASLALPGLAASAGRVVPAHATVVTRPWENAQLVDVVAAASELPELDVGDDHNAPLADGLDLSLDVLRFRQLAGSPSSSPSSAAAAALSAIGRVRAVSEAAASTASGTVTVFAPDLVARLVLEASWTVVWHGSAQEAMDLACLLTEEEGTDSVIADMLPADHRAALAQSLGALCATLV
jgi:hypothetical protein